MNIENITNAAKQSGCIPRRDPNFWNDVQVFATPDALEKFFKEAWQQGFIAGFAASGEGWNGEFPFQDRSIDIKADKGIQLAMAEAWSEA